MAITSTAPFNANGLPAVGAYLLVYPEQVDCGAIDEPTYAVVDHHVSPTKVTVTLRGNLAFTFDASSAILAF